MKYNPPEKIKWPKKKRNWNAKLIPAYLAELARQGKYYESKVLTT